jgi:hypothetical protein
MTVHTALAIVALALSILLFFLGPGSRPLAAVALVSSALEAAMAYGVLVLHYSRSVPLQLVLGAAIAVPALVLWLRANGKAAVSGSAILGFVGILQVALSLLR